jgi:hypothetical protein
LSAERRDYALCSKSLQKRIGVRAGIVFGLVLLCAMFLGSSWASGQEHNEKLSKKELKELIATAKNAEDHLRIAAYYRAQANDYLARQKEHLADEEEYNRNPQKYPNKIPDTGSALPRLGL